MSLKKPQEAYDLIHKGRLAELIESYNITDNFGWNEVFKNCTEREIRECPRPYFDNALKVARVMQEVRKLFGKPVIVHSWYRDYSHNKRVGGSPGSFHLKGLACDFHVSGLATVAGNRFVQDKLDKAPFMAACGMEWTKGTWCHVDRRSEEDGKRLGYRFHA